MTQSLPIYTLSLEKLVDSIDSEFAEELVKAESKILEDKAFALTMAKKLLVKCDDIDEEICTSIDYLQCQVDHLKNQQQVLSVLKHQERFTGEFSDIRHLVRELRDSLMESIRYGKRTREIDEVLLRLGELITIASQLRIMQPPVTFTGIETAISPRCSNCSTSCLSAFRKVQVFLLKLIKAIKTNYEEDSNSKAR